MKKIILVLAAFVFSIKAQPQASNTNTATVSGLWWDCSTWNNPIRIYNTPNDNKIINPNVTVNVNRSESYAKKVTLGNGSRINLNGNKILFTGTGTAGDACTTTASGFTIIDRVTVNFNEAVAAKSLSGFLWGLYKPSSTTNPYPYPYPVDNYQTTIMPLKPKLFRQGYREFYQDSYNIAGRVHMELATMWNDQYKDIHSALYHLLPGDNGWTNWHNYIDSWITWARIDNKQNIVWEFWNEPNLAQFWPGSFETNKLQIFNAYKEFSKRIKDSLGTGALVAGPSYSGYHLDMMNDFFEYCLKESIKVNVVTWHEFEDHQTDTTLLPYTKLKEHVEEIRTKYMNNPKYASLGIQSIEINESINRAYRHNPAVQANYLGNLEQSGVDYACKSCWETKHAYLPSNAYHNYDTIGSCASNTFNNLFTITGKRKANWWVYKLYADGVAARVKSQNETGKSIIIASSNISLPSTPVFKQVLYGYTENGTGLPLTGGAYSIRVNNVGTPGTIYYVNVRQIPNPTEEITELLKLQTVTFWINTPITLDAAGGYDLLIPAQNNYLYQLMLSTAQQPLPAVPAQP